MANHTYFLLKNLEYIEHCFDGVQNDWPQIGHHFCLKNGGVLIMCDYLFDYIICDYIFEYIICDCILDYIFFYCKFVYIICDWIFDYIICDYLIDCEFIIVYDAGTYL